MKKNFVTVFAVIVLGIFAIMLTATAEDLTMSWKNGLRFQSADEQFKFSLGGRIQNDWAFFDFDDALGDVEDGNEFRRARLYLAGTIYGNIDFKAEYDFAGGDADFKDVYMGIELPGLGRLKAGHFKEAFTMDELTSSKYLTFMERALPILAFSPSRNTGIGVFGATLEDRATWSIGGFRETDGFGDGEGSDYNFTARVTAVPWQTEEQNQLLHLGLSYSYKNTDIISYSARPESHLAPSLVDIEDLAVESVCMFGLESALKLGALSFQGEYILTTPDVETGSDPDLSGFYVMASYFLTGEQRPYKSTAGVFSRVKPQANLGSDEGSGAWELAARYSSLDLDDKAVAGGELDDITLGVNWYLNPNARIAVNYVMADADAGDASIYQARFMIDF